MDHQPQSPGSDSDRTIQVHNQSIVVPATASLISIADSFEKKEHSWFVTSQIPTDLSIQVQDITFYVHKFPLVSRCGYLANTDLQPNDTNLGYDIKLENFPGGSETFEIVLRFCYGLPVGLNPKNVAALRCASEYLDMTEAQEEGNLISKTEVFLTFVVLSSWRDSITVLKSCETLSPWAENLQIVRRCGDSIAWNVSREKDTIEEIVNDEFWWFDDMVTLRIDHFMRIMTAVRAKGLKPEIIGACIMRYAEKRLKGLGAKNEMEWCILNGRRQGGGVGHGKEQRMIVESLVSILPPEKEAVSCKFLAWMLKMAITCSASTALIFELEKRVGMVLENANVDDLLIPNYILGDPAKQENSCQEQTMHNVDAVQRILEYFLMHEQQHQRQKPGKLNISKLLDSYLAEIAKDPNLSITKFQVLAEAIPENVRKCDDGLYRAIDTYLKTHPSLSDHDRRRLCKVMHCEKLSLDACMHAAQNDRLPLRTIIQVLFSEQVKMRTAVQGKEITESSDNSEQESSWPSTKKEIKALKSELEKVKIKMTELQKDHSELQQEYVKLNHKQRRISSWSLGWSKIKKHAVLRGKIIGEEIDEGRQRSNSISRKLGFLRRRSIS